jgi:hypothetical protein
VVSGNQDGRDFRNVLHAPERLLSASENGDEVPIFEKPTCVRLTGEELAALRLERFTLDHWHCVECGMKVSDNLPDWHPRKAHLAHITSRGAGGQDTLWNSRTKCLSCHLPLEHHPKAVKAKGRI